MAGGDRVARLEANLVRLEGVLDVGLREYEGKDGGLVLVRMSGSELAAVAREIRVTLGELDALGKGTGSGAVLSLIGGRRGEAG